MAPHRMLALAGLLGALAVLLGAFAAHGLRAHVPPESLAVFETGVRYQMYHALALGLCGLLGRSGLRLRGPAACFALGTPLFSGSLYALALGAPGAFGLVTPCGGVALVLGWLLLAVAAGRAAPASQAGGS